MYPTSVSLGDGLDHGLRLLRSIVGFDKEVRGEFRDVEDVGNTTLIAELNNSSVKSAWHRTCRAKMTCFMWSRVVYSLEWVISVGSWTRYSCNAGAPIWKSLLHQTNHTIRQSVQPVRLRPRLHKMVFIQELKF